MSFDLWHTADPDAVQQDGNDLEPPADGEYTTALNDAAAFVSKKQQATVKLDFQLVGEDYSWTVILQFKSQGQANMTKRQVRELGVEVGEITSMEALDLALKEKVGGYYDVEVKTTGEFRNTYILGPATADPPPSDVPSGEGDFQPVAASPLPIDDEDIPF